MFSLTYFVMRGERVRWECDEDKMRMRCPYGGKAWAGARKARAGSGYGVGQGVGNRHRQGTGRAQPGMY